MVPGTGASVSVDLNENRVKTKLLQFVSRSLGRMRHSHQTLAPFAPGIGGEGLGMSDRLVDRQYSRFENLKVFEVLPALLRGSAPEPPGFFGAWRRKSTL